MITIKNMLTDGEDAERFVRFAYDWLGIPRDIKMNLYVDDHLIEHFSNGDYALQAILTPTAVGGTFNLILSSQALADPEHILAHEMIHLSQFVNGHLAMNVDTGACRWNNQEYAASYPYMERPWEKEAFKRQTVLVKAYKRFRKNI